MQKKAKVQCSVSVIKDLIGPKWTPCIVCRLLEGTKRFSDLQRELPQISHKMLSQRLRELERDDVIIRKVIPTVPIQTEYSLSPYGETLKELANHIHKWVVHNENLYFNPECIYFKQRVAQANFMLDDQVELKK